MGQFNKAINIALIFMLTGAYLCQDIAYCLSLRTSVSVSTTRSDAVINELIKKRLNDYVDLPGYKEIELSDLEKRNSEIRSHCKTIEKIIHEEGLLHHAELQSFEKLLVDVDFPHDRLLEQINGVACIASSAAGHNFDKLVYCSSGSDLITAVQFSDNILTIDEKNIFYPEEIWNSSRTKAQLLRKLAQKFAHGMHIGSEIRNLTDYAMELVLLGADLDSLKVTDEDREEGIITVQFEVNGRKITHTHFRYFLDYEPVKENSFLFNRLRSLIKGRNIAVLSKAGRLGPSGPNLSVSTIYPLLSEGTIIVSDVDKQQILPKDVHVSDLKQFNTKIDDALIKLRNKISSYSKSGKSMRFGYATDLREINFYMVTGPTTKVKERITQINSRFFL